ncbi:MAG: phenylalanine--tRNA ligase subunit beta [Bacteroidales bacterium]
MKISYNWLKDYLKIDLDAHKVAEVLTGIGLEVESVEDWESVRGSLRGVVIGQVLTCKRHPDADKLFVTTVDIGSAELLHIVCGAPNVEAGQKVPVATVGTVVTKGDQSIEIKKSKIRGEISEGMICAEDELGLGTGHEGIMVLDRGAVPGTPAADYFKLIKDTVYEIGLTPNRIDSGSHFGVARDLAAYMNINMSISARPELPSVDAFRSDSNESRFEVIVENSKDCPRYSGLVISDVTIGESPEWLKIKLKSIGLNPISNVVDITNFVQHEIGQPLHAFDADKITDNKVIIRNLPDNTKFVTLDAVERNLSSRDLMICDTKVGMCIAGVFGGIESGVTSATRNIFLESAHFNPVSIRKTSKRHGLQTDASFRFERGTDPNITTWALERAGLLMKELANGKITSGIIDVYPEKIANVRLEVGYRNINRLIGKHIERGTIRRILELLDFTLIREYGDILLLEVPSYRVDVKQEADVIEEILRIYGYNNVEVNDHVNSTLSYIEKPDRENAVNIVSDMLTGAGFTEIMCNSLNPSAWYGQSEDFDDGQLVRLANPLSSDLNVMRQSLLYGGLTSIAWNLNRQNPDLKFYEFGNCYFRKNKSAPVPAVEDFSEMTAFDLFITGKHTKESWNSKPGSYDIFDIKSATEMVLSRLGVVPGSLQAGESAKKYFSESVTYSFRDKLVAEAGKISKPYLRKLDIGQDVYYSHLEWDYIMNIIKGNAISYRELPKYPYVRRDLAILVDKNVRFSQIEEIAYRTERNLLRETGLFDVYESDTLGPGKKSYAVSFILRDDRSTLTDKTIDKVMANLIRAFEEKLGAKIR